MVLGGREHEYEYEYEQEQEQEQELKGFALHMQISVCYNTGITLYLRRDTMACENKEKNEEKCTCPNKNCERHGVCCECVRAHREAGNLPMCMR